MKLLPLSSRRPSFPRLLSSRHARPLLQLLQPLAFFALASVLANAIPAQAAEAASGGIEPGTTIPRFMLPVINTETFSTSRKWGPHKWIGQSAKADEKKKVLIMSFFATWCEPCKKEMPELVRLYQTYGDQGLGVMVVSIDERKDREALAVFASEKKLPFPVVHDAWGVVARRYKYPGRLPYLIMAAGDGKVASAHVGYKEEFKHELEALVRKGLGLGEASAASLETKTKVQAGSEKKADPKSGDVKSGKGEKTAKQGKKKAVKKRGKKKRRSRKKRKKKGAD